VGTLHNIKKEKKKKETDWNVQIITFTPSSNELASMNQADMFQLMQ